MHSEDETPDVAVERVVSMVSLHIGGLVERVKQTHTAAVAFEPYGSAKRDTADSEARGALYALDQLAAVMLNLSDMYRALYGPARPSATDGGDR